MNGLTAFDVFCPIRKTRDLPIVNAVRDALWPVAVNKENGFNILLPDDLVFGPLHKNAEVVATTTELFEVAKIQTFHRFSNPDRYTPSVAEVVIQAWPSVFRLQVKGMNIVAFSNHAASSNPAEQTICLRKYKKDEGVTLHKGITVLYSGVLPDNIRTMDLACRGNGYRYDPEAKPIYPEHMGLYAPNRYRPQAGLCHV